MSQLGRIIYNSINVDFERYWNEFSVVNQQKRATSESAAGVEEFLNFADRDIIIALKERITAHELQQLKQWYEYVKDGTAFEFLRDKDLGGFWEFEKTLNNNDLVAGTFTRAAGDSGNASYIDPSTGLLKFENTADTPRYQAGKWGHGILLEGTRDNMILNHGMDHADWVKNNITVGADSTDVLDPAGGNTADKLTASAGNGTVVLTTTVDVGTDDGVFSIWIRSLSGDVEGEIRITDGGASVTGTTAFTANQDWQRVQVPYTNAGDPGDNWVFVIQVDINTEAIYVYGPQGEAGADVFFASNYIRADLSSELMPNSNDRNFTGGSTSWANVDLGDTFDDTNDLTITSDAANQFCTCAVAGAPTTVGQHYKMTFDVANIVNTWTIKSFDGTQTIGTVTANGAGQALTWKATTTGGYRIVANAVVTSADFDNFTLQRITKTRNGELLLYTAANIVDKSKGTIGFWLKPEWVYNKHANVCLYWAHDTGDAARHSSIFALSTGNLEFRVLDGGGNVNEIDFSMSGLSQDTWHYIVCTYDTTISNGLKIYIDGVLVATDTNNAFVPVELGTNIYIGTTSGAASHAFGVFDEFLIRKDALNASQIKRIYDMGRGLGEVRNRWVSVILNNPEFIERFLRGINRFNFEISMREKIT